MHTAMQTVVHTFMHTHGQAHTYALSCTHSSASMHTAVCTYMHTVMQTVVRKTMHMVMHTQSCAHTVKHTHLYTHPYKLNTYSKSDNLYVFVWFTITLIMRCQMMNAMFCIYCRYQLLPSFWWEPCINKKLHSFNKYFLNVGGKHQHVFGYQWCNITWSK